MRPEENSYKSYNLLVKSLFVTYIIEGKTHVISLNYESRPSEF